mgnify:CR=1 FL=1
MVDVIIRGGTIIDGTGASGYRGDVAVQDGKITAIGDLSGLAAKKELDASGFVIAPGFIDEMLLMKSGSLIYSGKPDSDAAAAAENHNALPL